MPAALSMMTNQVPLHQKNYHWERTACIGSLLFLFILPIEPFNKGRYNPIPWLLPTTMAPNPYILAADNSPSLLPLLRSNPSLASGQDEHGYSLLHAAASYGHIDLLRSLVQEFKVNINLTDEDGETCLFVTEKPEIARCLVEELGIDTGLKNADGLTARESIEADGSFPVIASYLRGDSGDASSAPTVPGMEGIVQESRVPPPLPPNVTVDVGTMSEPAGEGEVIDSELKRRIDELASKENFHSEEGQRELRALITDAVRGAEIETQPKDAKRRID